MRFQPTVISPRRLHDASVSWTRAQGPAVRATPLDRRVAAAAAGPAWEAACPPPGLSAPAP